MASATLTETIAKLQALHTDAAKWAYLPGLLTELSVLGDPLSLKKSTPAADGAADMSCTLFILGSGIDLTGFTPTRAGQIAVVWCTDSTTDASITCGAGVTLNVTGNNKALFNDNEDFLVMVALSTTRWLILLNVTCTLSTV